MSHQYVSRAGFNYRLYRQAYSQVLYVSVDCSFISTLEASFAWVLTGRTLLEILVIVFVCRILIFMHMAMAAFVTAQYM